MTPTGPRRRRDDLPAWWSSDATGVDPDEDPLAAHLAARGLRAVAESGSSHGPDEPAEQPVGGEHPPGICGVCPICRGHALLRERHPEVADHLADAARSLSAALATFADLVEAESGADRPGAERPGAERARAGGPRAADRPSDGFRPIPLDDEEGGAR